MGRIVDLEGKELDTEDQRADLDEYSKKALVAVETLRQLVTQMIQTNDLTFYQTLGAITSLQAHMVSTLMQREHAQTLEEETEKEPTVET